MGSSIRVFIGRVSISHIHIKGARGGKAYTAKSDLR